MAGTDGHDSDDSPMMSVADDTTMRRDSNRVGWLGVVEVSGWRDPPVAPLRQECSLSGRRTPCGIEPQETSRRRNDGRTESGALEVVEHTS